MKILNGFWFNAFCAFMFGMYGIAYFTGAATPGPFTSGMMALAIFCNCLNDAINARDKLVRS